MHGETIYYQEIDLEEESEYNVYLPPPDDVPEKLVQV
jgi:hypothetical protein